MTDTFALNPFHFDVFPMQVDRISILPVKISIKCPTNVGGGILANNAGPDEMSP